MPFSSTIALGKASIKGFATDGDTATMGKGKSRERKYSSTSSLVPTNPPTTLGKLGRRWITRNTESQCLQRLHLGLRNTANVSFLANTQSNDTSIYLT
jgi:hypothetical protein